MEFKDRLRATRKQKQISQEKLADLLGLTKQAISHYERGTRFPTNPDILLAISDILNVSTDYLMGKTDITTQLLSESEFALLTAYRHASKDTRAAINAILQI